MRAGEAGIGDPKVKRKRTSGEARRKTIALDDAVQSGQKGNAVHRGNVAQSDDAAEEGVNSDEARGGAEAKVENVAMIGERRGRGADELSTAEEVGTGATGDPVAAGTAHVGVDSFSLALQVIRKKGNLCDRV